MSVFIVSNDSDDIESVYGSLEDAKAHKTQYNPASRYFEIQEWEFGRNIFKNVWHNNRNAGWIQSVKEYGV